MLTWGKFLMQVKATKFKDAWLFTPNRFGDSRGWFCESYKQNEIEEILGMPPFNFNFIQDSQSLSVQAGTIRGLHYQEDPFAQTKLVQVLHGSIYDVIVDIRPNSETFGQWQGFMLSDRGAEQLLVPKGFAHGFYTLLDNTRVMYKVDAPYSKTHDKGIAWNDEDLAIDWFYNLNPILSDKDRQHPRLREVFK